MTSPRVAAGAWLITSAHYKSQSLPCDACRRDAFAAQQHNWVRLGHLYATGWCLVTSRIMPNMGHRLLLASILEGVPLIVMSRPLHAPCSQASRILVPTFCASALHQFKTCLVYILDRREPFGPCIAAAFVGHQCLLRVSILHDARARRPAFSNATYKVVSSISALL
jgi:hypothetical protein